MPLYIGKIVDYMAEKDFESVSTLTSYMLIVIVVSSISVGMRASIFNILSERVSRNLRKDYFASIMANDIAFFDARRSGELITRLNADI